jgi:hypothetical protein
MKPDNMSNEKEEMTHDKEGDSKFIAEAKRFSDEVRNQYRASLRQRIAEQRAGYVFIRDGWKQYSDRYESYDLAVRIHDKILSIIDEKQ